MALSVGRSCPTKDEFLMEVGKSQSLMEVLVSRFGIRYQTIITVCVCVCVAAENANMLCISECTKLVGVKFFRGY